MNLAYAVPCWLLLSRECAGGRTSLNSPDLLPKGVPLRHCANLLERLDKEALIDFGLELDARQRVLLDAALDCAFAVVEPDGQFDLVLDSRERRGTGQVIQQSPQRLLEVLEVRRLPGRGALRVKVAAGGRLISRTTEPDSQLSS